MDPGRRAAQVVALLQELGHPCALVGGLAVSVRGRERFTRDLDFAVAVADDEQAESLTFSIQTRGFELKQVVEQEALGRLATARFRHPDDRLDEPTVELLFGATGIEREIVAGATPVALGPDVTIPVARLPHLVAMKVLSQREGREQDLLDLSVLLGLATEPELTEAERLVRLIEERGFDRGRDLRGELQRLRRQLR